MVIIKGERPSNVDIGEVKAAMKESFMVKHYWPNILALTRVQQVVSQPVFEYIVSLFITVKGFAMARKEHDKLSAAAAKKKQNTVAKSSSLRKNLKSMKK